MEEVIGTKGRLIIRCGMLLAVLTAGCVAACGCGRFRKPEAAEDAIALRGEQLKQVSLVYESGRSAYEEQLKLLQERKENFTDLIDSLTTDQKLAQRMILTNRVDMEGQVFRDCMPGGILLFTGDFSGRTADRVRKHVDALQDGMLIPMLVGVDEEGGTVSRIRGLTGSGIPVFEGARKLFEQGGCGLVREDAEKKSLYLRQMGINLNFAPDADVVKAVNSYMYARSASGDPEEVAAYVRAVVSGMQDGGMGSCLKHFPGYGENVNTHTTFAVDHRSLKEYREGDFLPFQAGISEGADMVMVSHIVMEQVDDSVPASLSIPVHRLLREELEFDGVVICDDLVMQAIRRAMSMEEAAAAALLAGNDMIFVGNFQEAMQGARSVYDTGEMTEEELNASLLRIFRLKRKLGLLE